MNDLVSIPYLSIKPSYIVSYSEIQHMNGARYVPRGKIHPPECKDHKGLISGKASSKIKNAVDYVLYLSTNKKIVPFDGRKRFTFRVGFITLTLSSAQVHTDDEIKAKLLNQFLIEARKKWGVINYLWRAEAQKNGNIHFHILVDKFIPWSELRDTWNRIQNKLGYVDRYRAELRSFHSGGFQIRRDLLKKWSYKNQLKAYRTGSRQDWNSPNSTDVHSVKKIRNLSRYLGKYCTKNDGPRKIEGRLWGCNTAISKLRGAVVLRDSRSDAEIQKLAEKYPDSVIRHDYFTVIYISASVLAKENVPLLYNIFVSYINGLRAKPT